MVELKESLCFPNFLQLEPKYFGSLNDLRKPGTSTAFLPYRWLFEIVIFNECYLDNIDKFENIALLDQDELIMPRKFQSLETFIDKLNFKKAASDRRVTSDYKFERDEVFKPTSFDREFVCDDSSKSNSVSSDHPKKNSIIR